MSTQKLNPAAKQRLMDAYLSAAYADRAAPPYVPIKLSARATMMNEIWQRFGNYENLKSMLDGNKYLNMACQALGIEPDAFSLWSWMNTTHPISTPTRRLQDTYAGNFVARRPEQIGQLVLTADERAGLDKSILDMVNRDTLEKPVALVQCCAIIGQDTRTIKQWLAGERVRPESHKASGRVLGWAATLARAGGCAGPGGQGSPRGEQDPPLAMAKSVKQLWEEAKENNRRVFECQQHLFEGKAAIGVHMTCRRCGGSMALGHIGSYIRGWEAAGKDANEIWPGWSTRGTTGG